MAVALDLHVLGDPPCPDGPPGPGRCGRGPRASRARPAPWGRAGAARTGALLGRGGAARPGPGDRVGRQLVALGLEEQLGARADHLEGRVSARRTGTGSGSPGAARGTGRSRRAAAGRGPGWQVERLAPGQHDLNRLAGRDRVLGDLDRMDVARRDRGWSGPASLIPPRGGSGPRPGDAAMRELARAGPSGSLEGLEDRPLRDPVAAFEVRRVGVQAGDRATWCGSGGRTRGRGPSR